MPVFGDVKFGDGFDKKKNCRRKKAPVDIFIPENVKPAEEPRKKRKRKKKEKVDPNTISFTNHAVDRFIERFPEESLADSWERSIQINMKEKKAYVGSKRKCDVALFDSKTYAVFVCVNNTCVTVIKGSHPENIKCI